MSSLFPTAPIHIHVTLVKSNYVENYTPKTDYTIFADVDKKILRIGTKKRRISGNRLYERYAKYGMYVVGISSNSDGEILLPDRDFHKKSLSIPKSPIILARGSTEDCEKYLGIEGELVEDIGLKRLRLMDGETKGGVIL